MKKGCKLILAFVCVLLSVFTLASCNGNKKYEGTPEDLLKNILIKEDGSTISGDFTVPATVKGADEVFDLVWTSKNEAALKFEAPVDGKVTAKVTQLKEDTVVHFEAAVTANGATASRDYRVKIGRLVPPEEMFYNFYDNASVGLTYNLPGYIIAKEIYDTKYNSASIYLMDQTLVGAYYCYSVKMTQEFYNTLNVGDAVIVQNVTSTVYNGLVETKQSGTIVKTDLPAKTVEELTTPVDITDLIMAKQTEETAKQITYKQSRFAKLEGFVVTADPKVNLSSTSTTQTIVKLAKLVDGNYAEFTLALNKKLVPLDSATATAISTKVMALKKGDVINLQGLVGWYNGPQFLAMDENCVTKTGTAEVPTKPEEPDPKPDELVEYTGTVTDAGFKDSDSSVRCFALVQNTQVPKYPGSAKYVTMTIDVTDTNTVEKIHADWLAKFPTGTNVTIKGKVSDYKGLSQFVLEKLDDVTVGEVENRNKPSFYDITAFVSEGKDLTSYQGMLVKVTGVCVVSGSNYSIETADGKSILVYYDRAFQEGAAKDVLTAGKEYTVSGFLNWFNNPQVTPINANAVKEIVSQFTETGTTIDFTKHNIAKETGLDWITFADGTLRANAGSASTAPRYWNNKGEDFNHIRTYVGNNIVISSTKKIAKIEFTLASSTKDGGTFTVGETALTVENGKITWTGDANKVEFVVSGNQCHFTSIVVTYAE